MNGFSLDALLPFLPPILVGIVALAFVTMPLWSGSSGESRLRRAAHVVSREQLELDRELGKIDAAEYDELHALLPKEEPKFGEAAIESLVGTFRRRRKVEMSVEAEVLVARVRRSAKS